MIKVFETTQDYEIYSADGLKSGEFCYVVEDKTVYFRTNNIDGEDKVYNTDGGSDEPEYTELNLNTLPAKSDGKNFSTMITATVGQTIEIYNPNHLNFQVGQGQPAIDIVTGENDGYQIFQNGIGSYDYINANYLEHLYAQNAPDIYGGTYSDYGFAICYYSEEGTPVDGVIYYRIIDA